MRIVHFLVSCGLLLISCAQAANITMTGDWARALWSGDLVDDAGTDFRSLIESDSYQGILGITETDGSPWTLRIQVSARNFPQGVSLQVRRTNSGNGGNILGGMSYLTVSEQDQILFSGQGDCTGVALQFSLTGVSIQQPPGGYNATLIYSVQ